MRRLIAQRLRRAADKLDPTPRPQVHLCGEGLDPDAVVKAIRHHVRVSGGDVQRVLGR